MFGTVPCPSMRVRREPCSQSGLLVPPQGTSPGHDKSRAQVSRVIIRSGKISCLVAVLKSDL